MVAYGTHLGQTILVWYNIEAKQSFSSDYLDKCYHTTEERRPYIENDIFGFEPLYFRNIDYKQNVLFSDFSLSNYLEDMDLDCVKKKNVKNSIMRDLLIEKIKNQTGNENQILVIMHLKK